MSSPVISAAPRIETSVSGKSMRYEFRNVKDLVSCLNDGTFLFELQVLDRDFETTGKFTMLIRGRYSDRGLGSIHIGLQRRDLELHEEDGKKRLVYPFLQEDDESYLERYELDDTQDDWSTVRKHYNIQLREKLAKYISSEDQITVFEPKQLKMAIPSENSVTKVGADGNSEVVVPKFVLSSYIREPGSLMVRFGNLWKVETKKVNNILVGWTMNLDKFKLLSDDEKRDQKLKKAVEKRKREGQDEAAPLQNAPKRRA